MNKDNLIRDEQNRVVINMTVKDDGNFLSVYSQSDMPVISSEVADFLETSVFAVPPTEELTLKIKSDCIDESEKIVYEKAIKEYYRGRNIHNERELKRNNLISFVLAVVGVLVLAFAVFVDSLGANIWAEVVDIAAWVFLWEAVDMQFFKSRELKINRLRNQAFMSAKIEYV